MTDGFGGRFLEIHIGGVGAAVGVPTKESGVQSRTITRNRAEIDVTSDDDTGWRSLVPEPGTRSVDLSISGVMSEDNYDKLLARFEAESTRHMALQIYHPNDSSVTANERIRESGNFFLQSLETTGEHSGAITFSATFLSSGPVTRSSVPNGVVQRGGPVFERAIATAATRLILIFNRDLDSAHVPANSAFTVLGGAASDAARAVASATIEDNVVVLTFGAGVLKSNDVLTVAYAPPNTDPLQDSTEALVAAIETTAVTNLI